MSGSAVATGGAYSAYLIIILAWLVGAYQTGDWKTTTEVITAFVALAGQLAHNLTPLGRALLKKIFGYDPYAPTPEVKP